VHAGNSRKHHQEPGRSSEGGGVPRRSGVRRDEGRCRYCQEAQRLPDQ
jgi:hypothetical protein